jgi:hypothetical protein
MRRIGLRTCLYCGRAEVFTSLPQARRDTACCFFFLQVVRCHCCTRSYYRSLFLPPVSTLVGKKLVQNTTNDEQRGRSA